MDLASRRMHEAILRIDTFIEATASGTLSASPEQFRELSCCIQLARSARLDYHTPSAPLLPADLAFRYQQSLERLQVRLQQLEVSLSAERARLLAEHSRLARTREWQEQFSRTR